MKVMLIRYHDGDNINSRVPESLSDETGIVPPLGLAYLAAVLEKNNYEVRILDCIIENLTKNETFQKIREYKPDIVGVTAMTPTIKGALEACKLAKDAGAIVVIGGTALAGNPVEIMSYNYIDYGMWGECDFAFTEFVKAIEKNKNVKKIKGLIYREKGKIKINEPEIIKDLNLLPYPARHLLPINEYKLIIAKHPMTTLVTGRGCPYNCAFCFKAPGAREFRKRSVKSVVDEMEYVIRDYNIKEIVFVDDNLLIEKEYVKELCNEIIKRNINIEWESPSRIDIVDEDLIKLLKKAGCRRLRYGVESGDENILKVMNKNISINKVKEVFKLTKKYGIEAFAYFIIGYIGETPDTIKKTIRLAKEIEPDMILFTAATPLPKTLLYEQAKKQKLFKGDYWADYILGKRNDRIPYFIKDTDKWIKKAYRDFYFRPGYIIKYGLLKIRNWDDIKKRINALAGLLRFKMDKNE